jgi:hypothetical protein
MNVEFSHYFNFVEIIFTLPVEEVDFFKQLLLMKLQFANHLEEES